MRILILDNYDSFTYNLVHLIEKVCDSKIYIFQNNKIKLEDVNNYDKILLSPGPGLPSESGIMIDLIKNYHKTKSILGICLGLQAIGEAFNSPLINLQTVFHGIATPINIIASDKIFENCPKTFNVGRYHSWVIDSEKINSDLTITAIDNYNFIMAIQHKIYDVKGVQFHPESILSQYGETIIKNWIYE